jgi:hypothetical protein
VWSRVNTTWASRCSECSVQVLATQAGSTQRQRRLRHTSRAGRPKQARSRMATGLRSRVTAIVPHDRQPTKSAVASIVTNHLGGRLDHLEDAEAVHSQQRLGQARSGTSSTQGPSLSSQPQTAVTMAGPLPRVVDPDLPTAPYSDAKSHFTGSASLAGDYGDFEHRHRPSSGRLFADPRPLTALSGRWIEVQVGASQALVSQ